MKSLRRIVLSVLIVLFLTVGLCFAQDTAEQSWNKGVEYASQGKFKEAKEEFEKTLKIDLSYGSARRYLKVIEDANEGKIQTDTAICFFEGVNHSLKEQFAEAIAKFDRVIEAELRYAIFYISRGNAYYDKGQYDKAISDYTKAIEINPKDAVAYNNRGIAYSQKGQYDKAISDYNRAIEINPRYAEAYNNRGIAYYAKENMKKACSDWKRACELGDCRNWGIANKIRCLGK